MECLVGQGHLACDFESQVLDHAIIIRWSLALGGQVIADEDTVGDHESQRLKGSEVSFSPTCNSQFALWVDESEHGKRS